MEPASGEHTPVDAKYAPEPDSLRAALVDSLINGRVVSDQRVLTALRTVPRHLFLPCVSLYEAYEDTAVPTHWNSGVAISSASQPSMVALMLEQLQVETGMNVLEIGAGTGYNAALLAELVGATGAVTTIDISPEFVQEARENLERAGYSRVRACAADGAYGWAESAPYDRIIVTAATGDITPYWFEQLKDGGLLVAPFWLRGTEASIAFRKSDGMLGSDTLTPCRFMPLRGDAATSAHWCYLPNGRQLFAERADVIAPLVNQLLMEHTRSRFFAPNDHAFVQFLGARGHDIFWLYTAGKSLDARRTRWGLLREDRSGATSMVISFSQVPVLLLFGGVAAEETIRSEGAMWRKLGSPGLATWRVKAWPRTEQPGDIADETTITRRHFVFTISFGGSQRIVHG